MINVTSTSPDVTPVRWYREAYVWLVILFPVLSIIMGITILTLSIKSFDGMVVDDYYKQGMIINEVLARDDKARESGLNARIDWEVASDTIQVELSADSGFNYPAELKAAFMHATRGGLDVTVELDRIGEQSYLATAPGLAPGRWHVEIAADDWRLLEEHWQE